MSCYKSAHSNNNNTTSVIRKRQNLSTTLSFNNSSKTPANPLTSSRFHQEINEPKKLMEGSSIRGDQRLDQSNSHDIRGIFSPNKKNVYILRQNKKNEQAYESLSGRKSK
jgi:hypothetical protein